MTTQTECPNCSQPSKQEKTFMTSSGDKYVVNEDGQIVQYKYHDQDLAYSFAYGDQGDLESINSTAGWTWRKANTTDFTGWIVRNYFDRWQVAEEECAQVYVEPTGIKARGRNISLMGLPEAC